MKASARLDWLEAQAAIRDLIAGYAFAVDDRDFAALGELFAADAHVVFAGGRTGVGRDDIVQIYRRSMARIGPCGHYMHDLRVDPVDGDTDAAHGFVTAHAELLVGGATRWVSLRYRDRYRRADSRWQIAHRIIDVRADRLVGAPAHG